MDHLPVLQEILYLRATSRDGDISKASVKIPGEKRGLRQAIFIVTMNGVDYAPSIFVLSRTAVRATIHEGCIPASNISIDSSDGSITVTKNVGSSLYWRLITCEW